MLGKEVDQCKGCQGSCGTMSLSRMMCVLCSTIANTQMGQVKMYLEVLCIMSKLEFLPLATTGHTEGITGSCPNPGAANTAISTKIPAYPLLDI